MNKKMLFSLAAISLSFSSVSYAAEGQQYAALAAGASAAVHDSSATKATTASSVAVQHPAHQAKSTTQGAGGPGVLPGARPGAEGVGVSVGAAGPGVTAGVAPGAVGPGAMPGLAPGATGAGVTPGKAGPGVQHR